MSRTSTFLFCSISLLLGASTVSPRSAFAGTGDIVLDLYGRSMAGENAFNEEPQAATHAAYNDLYARKPHPGEMPVVLLAAEILRDTDLFGAMRGTPNETAAAGQALLPERSIDLYEPQRDGGNLSVQKDPVEKKYATDDLYDRIAVVQEPSAIAVEESVRKTDIFGAVRGNNESAAAGQPADTTKYLYGTRMKSRNETAPQEPSTDRKEY
jgi:hypothetical protein